MVKRRTVTQLAAAGHAPPHLKRKRREQTLPAPILPQALIEPTTVRQSTRMIQSKGMSSTTAKTPKQARDAGTGKAPESRRRTSIG